MGRVAIVLLFTALLLSGCLGVVLCWCVAGMGGEVARGNRATIYSTSALRLRWRGAVLP